MPQCPITMEEIVEPVLLPCGHTFGRTALQRHFAGSIRRCPTCRKSVPASWQIVANFMLL